RQDYRIDLVGRDRKIRSAECSRERCGRAIGRQRRNSRIADRGSRREAAALARALIVQEKETQLGIRPNWTAQTAAEDVLLDRRTGLPGTVQEVLVGIQFVVAKELIRVAVKSLGSRFEDCVDVPASVSALAGIVKRSLYLEFTHHVGIGKRHVRGLGYVVIGRTDALDQIVVIVLALPVHNDAHIASPQLGGGVQFTLRPGGERQQLLKILRRQRQATNFIRLNRLSRGGGAGIDS